MIAYRTDRLIAGALLLSLLLVGWFSRSPLHGWGDDFAAYILQARALSAGAPAAELARNGALMDASDGQIGPSAAPWGLPILLWAVGSTRGWDIVNLKLVGVFALALLGVSAYLLARLYVGQVAAILVVLTLVLSPPIVESVDVIGSDLPFLAVSTAALLVMERAARAITRSRGASILTGALTALLCASGFAIRSNGLFLFACVGISFFLRWRARHSTRALVAELSTFVLVGGGCLAVYFLFLPDGSHAHLHALDFGAASMLRRVRVTASDIRGFIPFSWLPDGAFGKSGAVLSVLLALSLFARGVWKSGRAAMTQLTWVLLNLALLVVFKYDGGIRYMFPVILTLYLFAAVGATTLLQRLRFSGRYRRGLMICAAAVWLVALGAGALSTLSSPSIDAMNGPYAPTNQALVAFLKGNTAHNAKLSFFKPRALRLLTGRDVIRLQSAARIAEVDYVVLERNRVALRWESSLLNADSLPTGNLVPVFTNADAVVLRVTK